MAIVFFTGFPGFLGRELLPRVLRRSPDVRAVCLVQEKFLAQALAAVREMEQGDPALGRVELLVGDITARDLAVPPDRLDLASIKTIYHLAAVYDLSVARDLAVRVNVDGTRNVLDLAARCPRLERLHYVSTCYVSGRYAGVFSEDDLEKGQSFNNFYEETKYEAEVLVRKRMQQGLRATIYRPSIVVGDSKTGATQKLDGPYYFLRWLMRQPKAAALMPVVGMPERFRFNTVPRDFVVDAITYLSGRQETLGKTYQLADPNPPTCAEFLDIMARASGRRILHVPLSAGFARFALERIPGVHALLQLPPSLVDYMTHPTHYSTDEATAALAPAGIAAPPLAAYAPAMADFVRHNLSLGSDAMV
jgi:thioester reductase-like protein